MVRMNLTVEDDIPEKLSALAGSERKRGAYLSEIIRQIYNGHLQETKGDDLESLRLTLAGLAGKVKDLDARLSTVERNQARQP